MTSHRRHHHSRRLSSHFLLLSSALLTGGFASAAAAQTGAPASDPQAGEIIILGRGLPLPPATPAYGSEVLDRDRLEQEPSGRIENALADIAGFQQFRRSDSRSANPSAQGVTLRALGGNASSRALLLLDGVPQADPFFGHIPFTALVPERLGAVRITRGGGVGAFGAGAVAGTIEMVSADRSQLPLIDASALVGSRDAQELSASLSPDLGAGFVTISGRWERGDGFYTAPRDQRVAASVPTRYRDWSTSLRGVAPVGDSGEIQARIGIFRDNRTLRFAGADNSSEGQDASIRYLSHGRWKIDALAYVQSRNFSSITVSSTSYRPVLDQYDTPATGIGGKIEVRPPVGEDHVLRIGSDARFVSGTMLENAISAGTGNVTYRRRGYGRQMTTGFFIEDDWTLGKLILTAGARADRWTITRGAFHEQNATGATTRDDHYPKRDGWEGSFRAGALWHANAVLALRMAGYTGFRLPTLNELYRGFTVFPVVTTANPDLKPEKLKGAEAGFELTPLSGVRLSATAFYNRLDNAIANVTIGTNLRQRRNVDRIVAKGVELSGEVALGQVHLTASWAYSDSKVHDGGNLDGQIPAQSPHHMATVGLGWQPVEGGSIGARLRYVGPQYEDDLGVNRMPDAVTVDGYAQWPLAYGVSLVGRVENLFDERVVTRQVGTSLDLGTPRTVWVGVKFSG
ncbi:MAG: TonB-dependent receptor [Sphingomonadales bacterium]|nr:MAG: TonB-dependent receptor [Sphingomonadales bacterium]TNF03268.1 MAG: TonB-dependent receptor [Sphingomonadales bacterium]